MLFISTEIVCPCDFSCYMFYKHYLYKQHVIKSQTYCYQNTSINLIIWIDIHIHFLMNHVYNYLDKYSITDSASIVILFINISPSRFTVQFTLNSDTIIQQLLEGIVFIEFNNWSKKNMVSWAVLISQKCPFRKYW